MKQIEDIRIDIGKRAAYARKMENLSVPALAEKAGVSAPTVRSIESGKSGVAFDNYLKVGRALHCLSSFTKLFEIEIDLFKEAELER